MRRACLPFRKTTSKPSTNIAKEDVKVIQRHSSAWAVLVVLLAPPVQADPPQKIDFAHGVAPLLKARCAECHTNGKYKGGLSLDTRADVLRKKVVVPGKSADSELFQRITSTDPDERMPPKGAPLSPQEIALVKAWIDQGLSWDAGFTFKRSTYVPTLK